MKVYVLGSNSFVNEMVKTKDELRALGLDGWIHQDYQDHVDGVVKAIPETHGLNGESADFKRAHDYINQHYKHILESDAIIIVNLEKKGIKNYIGGNCLMEIGMAYVNKKKVFLSNDMPTDLPYLDEIKAMDPICLHGNLSNIKKYIK